MVKKQRRPYELWQAAARKVLSRQWQPRPRPPLTSPAQGLR